MAFWGVHLQPGRPFTHRFDKLKGRIRISQATLGAGALRETSAVQCTVGDKDPILVCAFLPSKKVSCPLDLEFEEEDDVVFAVTGPRSVYLAGFYMRNSSSEKVITENKIVEVGGGCGTRADSHAGQDAAHISDEGTRHERKKRKMTEAQNSIENANTVDDGKQISEHQESIAADISDEGYRHERKKKKKKKKKTEAQKSIENTNTEDDGKQMSELQESIAAHVGDEGYKHERKKKKKKKMTEAQKSIADANTGDGEKQMSEPQESIKTENSEDEVKKMSIASHVSDKGDRHMRKKKKMPEAQKSIEKANTEDEGKQMSESQESNKTISTEEEEKKMSEPQESIAAHVNDDGNRHVQKKKMSGVKKSIENGNTDNELKKMTEAQKSIDNANTEDDEIKMSEPQKSFENANTKDDEKNMSEPQETIKTTNTEDGEKKMIEAEESIKTAITEDEEHKMSEDELSTAITEEGVTKEVIPLQEKSFSNGMVITDLAYGEGGGEGAFPGSRVTVNYISYRDGEVIDSKLDGSFKFRLGAKKVIKGLDVGINGMRVGDKRRLTIPPSMTTDGKEGFAAGKGKSYLICDVELVNIK